MRMQPRVSQDEEIGYIYDTYAKIWRVSSQERGCSNYFEIHFDANTDEYAIVKMFISHVVYKATETTHTSGLTPLSTLANFHTDAPAIQC